MVCVYLLINGFRGLAYKVRRIRRMLFWCLRRRSEDQLDNSAFSRSQMQ